MDSLSFKRKTFSIFDKNEYFYGKEKDDPNYYVKLYYLFSDGKNNLHIEIEFKDNDLFNNSNYLNESELFSYLDDEDVIMNMRYEKKIVVKGSSSIKQFGGFFRHYTPSYVESIDVLRKTFRGYLEEGLNELYILLFSNHIKIDYPIHKFIFLRNEFSEMAYEYFSNKELSNAIRKNLLNKDDRLVGKFTKDKVITKADFSNFMKGLNYSFPKIGIENFSKEVNFFTTIWKVISFSVKLPIFIIPLLLFVGAIINKVFTSNFYNAIDDLNIFAAIFGAPMLFGIILIIAAIINFVINIPGYILSFIIEIYLYLKCILLKRSFGLKNQKFGLKKTFYYDKDMLYSSGNSVYSDDGLPSFSSNLEQSCCCAIVLGYYLFAALVSIIVFILYIFNLVVSFF
jgi:hypothetical protein